MKVPAWDDGFCSEIFKILFYNETNFYHARNMSDAYAEITLVFNIVEITTLNIFNDFIIQKER